MNYRRMLLSSIFALCTGVVGTNSLAYGVSASSWKLKLPNGSHIYIDNLGDAHSPGFWTDLEQLCVLQNTVERFKEMGIPFILISEENPWVAAWRKKHDMTIEPVLLAQVNGLNTMYKKGDFGSVDFCHADLRGVAYSVFWVGCSELDKLCEKVFKQSGAKGAKESTILKIFKAQMKGMMTVTKKQFIDELESTLMLAQTAPMANDPLFAAIVSDVEAYYKTAKTLFEECPDDKLLLDFICDYCSKHGIQKFFDTFAPLYDLEEGACIGNVGFIIEIHNAIKKNQHIMLYTGDLHKDVIDQYLQESLKAECINKIESKEDQVNPYGLPIDPGLFAQHCQEFMDHCACQSMGND